MAVSRPWLVLSLSVQSNTNIQKINLSAAPINVILTVSEERSVNEHKIHSIDISMEIIHFHILQDKKNLKQIYYGINPFQLSFDCILALPVQQPCSIFGLRHRRLLHSLHTLVPQPKIERIISQLSSILVILQIIKVQPSP